MGRVFWGPPFFCPTRRPFFNFENQFDVWEDWPGGSGVAYIETFQVTETGLEVMSNLPRTLVVV